MYCLTDTTEWARQRKRERLTCLPLSYRKNEGSTYQLDGIRGLGYYPDHSVIFQENLLVFLLVLIYSV